MNLDEVETENVSTGSPPRSAPQRLYRSEHLRLLRFGFLLTSDRQVAEDAVQEAFASLTQRHGEIQKPVAYLRQVVVNRINDGHRRAARGGASREKVAIGEAELDET